MVVDRLECAVLGLAACERCVMDEPGRVVVDSEAGRIELCKGSMVELRGI